jgi:hypothetical protein
MKKLDKGVQISGIINFSGPVDGLDVVEKCLWSEVPLMKDLGNAFLLVKDMLKSTDF